MTLADLDLGEEQIAFQETARDFAMAEFEPHAARWDEDCVFPIDALLSLIHI